MSEIQNVTPIFDPDRGWRVWSRGEIYTGPEGSGRHVPHINDMVIDYDQGFLKVIDVNLTTGLSTLEPWSPPENVDAGVEDDVLLGAGPGRISESFRAYVDTSVLPHTMALDARLRIYGTTTTSVKVFQGLDIGVEGAVVSAWYNQNNELVGENIPLELVAMPDHTNKAVKTPQVGWITRQVADGEPLTVVAYDDVGGVVSTAVVLAKNTSFVRSTDASAKYIIDISLDSPFLSAGNPRRLEYPINLPITSGSVMGVVTYSDGSKNRLPVDGTKFSLYGMDNYIATVVGQRIPLVLSYKLSDSEYTYGAMTSVNKHISIPYEAVSTEVDGAYTVKLFAYPVWVDDATGYRLEYFLYNLDRDAVYRATPYVQVTDSSPQFQPKEYGSTQQLTVAVELDKVDGSFGAYRHVQTLAVTLLQDGNTNSGTSWTMSFSPNQNPVYGEGLSARVNFINASQWEVDVSCGAANKQEWLDKVYRRTQPLYNPGSESQAPEPNFFYLVLKNQRLEMSVDQWDQVMTVANDLEQGEVMYLEFFRRIANDDLQLAVAGLPVHNITS